MNEGDYGSDPLNAWGVLHCELETTMNIPMQLSRIFIREMTDMQIIELSEVGGTRAFPIVIGLPEASAIERRLKGIEISRPQTHDLLANTIQALGGELLRIEITSFSQGTYFARLIISKDGQEIEIDSRPSDAIALGIAKSIPISVAEEVLEAASAQAAAGIHSVPEISADMEDEDDDQDDDEDENL
jgi:bifunctional DNase/RNase